jgi:hypothetical protein
MNDGKFEVLLVRAPRDLSEITECILAVQKQQYNCRMMTFRSAKEITVFTDAEMFWTLDGEKANGSSVPSERSSKRIRVSKGKKSSPKPEEIPIPAPTEEPTLEQEILGSVQKAETTAADTTQNVSAKLESLGEIYVKIYELIPKSGSVSLDTVLAKLGTNPGEIISCLTELETQGIIKSNTSGFSRA